MKKILFLFLILINFVKIIITKKVLIPFKTANNTAINYIESLLYNQLYATLEIGTNKQVVYLGISTAESLFAIEGADINEYNYNWSKSTSAKKHGGYIDSGSHYRYYMGEFINDTFYFYYSFDNKKENIKQYNNVVFVYVLKLGRSSKPEDNGYIDNNKNLISGLIGLQITAQYNNFEHMSIFKTLKKLDLIDKLVWTLNYTNDEEGYLIIGENPYQYNESYSEEKRKKTACTTPSDRDYSWTFSFTDIKSGKNKLNSYRYADYSPQYGLIKGTSEYLTIIKPYFQKLEKCELKEFTLKNVIYSYYECDINVNVNDFEPLTFIHTEFELEFILDKDDLFINHNGKKYFLVAFQSESSNQKWGLGKPFVKKYQFTFDHESKNIFYYEKIKNEPEPNKTSNTLIIIIVCSVLGIAAIILGIVLGKIFVAGRKKKKANELVDEVDNNKETNEEYNKLGV